MDFDFDSYDFGDGGVTQPPANFGPAYTPDFDFTGLPAEYTNPPDYGPAYSSQPEFDYNPPSDYATPQYEEPSSWGREARMEAAASAEQSNEPSWGREERTETYTPQSVEGSSGGGAFSQMVDAIGSGMKDPATLDKWMKMLVSGGSALNTLRRKGTPQNGLTPRQAAASMPGQQNNNFTPAQQQWATQFFNRPAPAPLQRERAYAADRPSAIRPARGYAEGGEVQMPAFEGYVQGPGGGQDDLIEANLAAGEYVFDADVVSALGDGDNAQGAAILDQFRESLRAHKRSADPSSIPPQALAPEAYMPEGALTQMMEG